MSGGHQAASTTMLRTGGGSGATYSGTFTAVDSLDGSGNGTIGASSASPATDSGGKTIATIAEAYIFFVYQSTVLAISGFSSDPGAAYFGTAIVNGTSKTAASASYSYNSGAGTASWVWGGGPFFTAGAGRTLSYT